MPRLFDEWITSKNLNLRKLITEDTTKPLNVTRRYSYFKKNYFGIITHKSELWILNLNIKKKNIIYYLDIFHVISEFKFFSL